MEVTAKVCVGFFLFGIFSYVISEEIVEEHQCKGKRLADAYVTNKVTEVRLSLLPFKTFELVCT